jgi:YD repeat-containing protein
MSVRPEQRHKRSRPCLICGGGDDMPRGHQKRCSGFISDDGEYEHCSRDEFAFGLPAEDGGTYAHRMHGPCRCGSTHGEARSGSFKSDDVEAIYEYRDERNVLLFQVVRKRPKRFLQRRPDGDGWIWQTNGVRRVLYRTPQLVAADKDKTVYVVEGEKDVETLERLGHIATTNPGGAGKWSFVVKEAKAILAGRNIVVVSDADPPGRKHAVEVAESLRSVAKTVRLVEAPAPHKDATEFIESGGSFEDITTEPPISGFTIKWADALAEPLPPVEWLCKGYGLPRACYALIAGESYSGKSLWITDLAMAVASGGDALGLYRARQGRVLWLDYDGQGERITRTRLQRMSRARGYDLRELGDQFGYVWLPEARLDDPDALDVFSRLFEGVAFAVIDSWRGAAPNTEEKDRGAVQKVGNTILRVIEKTGVTPMIVDHTIKPAREGKSTRSAMHDIHGSSAKSELAQWVVMFEKQEDKPVKVRHTKERMEARTMDPFGLRYEDVAQHDDPRWGLKCVHLSQEQLDEEEGGSDVLLDKTKDKVLAALKSRDRAFTSASQIHDAIGGRRATVLAAVNELLSERRVYQAGIDGQIRVSRPAYGARA